MVETIQLRLLLATFASWVNRMQTSVTAYLIEDNRILKEQLTASGKRIRFTDDQRRRLAAKAKVRGRKTLNKELCLGRKPSKPGSLLLRTHLADCPAILVKAGRKEYCRAGFDG